MYSPPCDWSIDRSQVSFCKGSATDLMSIVGSHLRIERNSAPTVVTCVNNTLGVFPDAIKPRTYSQVGFDVERSGVERGVDGRCHGSIMNGGRRVRRIFSFFVFAEWTVSVWFVLYLFCR